VDWLHELLWDDENIEHISRHGVDGAEVEEVVFDGGTMTAQAYHPLRTLFVGATDAGRFLLVVVARIGENQGRVVTARDASRKERDAYKRWREAQ
jgi:uncharacterized DUF497 family protein